MHLSIVLVLSAACAIHGATLPKALWEFGGTIQCVQPGVNPLIYNEYGCWCGLGGGGTPKDAIDRCCRVHDLCYESAGDSAACAGALPHLKSYSFTCSNQRVICSSSNDACQAAVCECDRAAAHCFANYNYVYNSDYKYLDSKVYCN
ncbi:phospholipase A2, minor isoenzyme-like [Chanos chanos]|uniref:Phospholipase A2 n=1 Tax=Chanos chanos TaxID=29144 RepID=A0A6J2UN85_CHACN|nr:phospholipase A2, minor isoenzyme-like [Chanos chanos]